MSVQEHTSSVAATTTSERSVYQSLFDKINLSPVSALKNVDAWQSDEALSDAAPAERVTAAIQVLVSCLADAAQPVERLDKTLLDEQIARLDKQISDQVNEVMHHAEFQKQESLWRGLHSMITGIDFRRNIRVEMMISARMRYVMILTTRRNLSRAGYTAMFILKNMISQAANPLRR